MDELDVATLFILIMSTVFALLFALKYLFPLGINMCFVEGRQKNTIGRNKVERKSLLLLMTCITNFS